MNPPHPVEIVPAIEDTVLSLLVFMTLGAIALRTTIGLVVVVICGAAMVFYLIALDQRERQAMRDIRRQDKPPTS